VSRFDPTVVAEAALPLSLTAICADCESLFLLLVYRRCPTCASQQIMPLGAWLRSVRVAS
jgi:hypothetical protein